MTESELAAAIASRICHDLVSPVGAIVNGVDLMRSIGPGDMADAVGMIGQSAGRASALLQFYRIAFGAAAPDAPEVARATLRELVSVLAQPPRIALEWRADGQPMRRAEARLAGLIVLCARSVTGMRGVIRLDAPASTAFPLVASVDAEAFAATAEMLPLLDAAPADGAISPRAVEFVLARQCAAALGARIDVVRASGRITITAGAAASATGSPGADAESATGSPGTDAGGAARSGAGPLGGALFGTARQVLGRPAAKGPKATRHGG